MNALSDCCSASNSRESITICPSCKNKGKHVSIITLKSLLSPCALEKLQPEMNYYFCSTADCKVAYFNSDEQTFTKEELKVRVFQKESDNNIPICYCFNWTKHTIMEDLSSNGKSTVIQKITSHIKANRCGCEVNNPQGSCCLGNVTGFVRSLNG